MILYGSVARGTVGPNSDVDLCVVVPTWQDVALEVTRHGMADYLRGKGIAVGSEAGQVHMSCFDEEYLRQNRFGIGDEFCQVTAEVFDAINSGRILHV